MIYNITDMRKIFSYGTSSCTITFHQTSSISAPHHHCHQIPAAAAVPKKETLHQQLVSPHPNQLTTELIVGITQMQQRKDFSSTDNFHSFQIGMKQQIERRSKLIGTPYIVSLPNIFPLKKQSSWRKHFLLSFPFPHLPSPQLPQLNFYFPSP